jgi:hypothetical protein
MKWILLPIFIILAAGCVATGPKESRQLPASMESYFRICSPLNGAMVVRASDEGNLLGSSEMEWESEEAGWDIEISNSAGFNLATIVNAGRKITITGQQAGRLPPMAVNTDGFLEVDGNFIGIKAREIPCLLASALPRSWTPFIYSVEGNQDDRFKILIEDDEREIVVRTRHLGDQSKEQICADISWRNKLIFRSTLKWCVEGKDLNTGEISGINDLSVKWVRCEG